MSPFTSRRWESILPPLLLLLLGALLCGGDDGFDIDREIHQPIILYVSGVPLHVVIGVYVHILTHIPIDIYAYIHTYMRRTNQKTRAGPRSEALAVGMEQCHELLVQGVLSGGDLKRCSEEFARSLRPHIAELREVFLYTCMCVCMRTHTHTHTHSRIRAQIHTHKHARTHTHTHQKNHTHLFTHQKHTH